MNDKLNALLSNYVTMFHKLQNYHWYVKGDKFFADHVKLEEYYDEFFAAIDEIAEKLLMVGGDPTPNMAEFGKLATIEEAGANYIDHTTMWTNVLADFNTLLDQAKDLKAAADDEDNYLISALADELIDSLSKHTWMLRQTLA